MELNSEKIDKIVPALIEARKKITGVTKDEDNPFFKSKYANLTSIIQAVNSELLESEIIITQPTCLIDEKLFSITQCTHSSGQWVRAYLPIINKKGDDQGQGSGLTYARRYGLQALLTIPAFDDDGELTKAKNGNGNGKKDTGNDLDDLISSFEKKPKERKSVVHSEEDSLSYNQSYLNSVFTTWSEQKRKAKVKYWSELKLCLPDLKDVTTLPDERCQDILEKENLKGVKA